MCVLGTAALLIFSAMRQNTNNALVLLAVVFHAQTLNLT